MVESTRDNLSIRADNEKRRLYFSQRGILDKESVFESYHLMLAFDGYDTGYDRIADYREITQINLNAVDFREIIAEGLELSNQNIRAAIVIGDDAGRLFLLKLFCELSNIFSAAKVVYKAFRTMPAAEEWLDSKP